MSALNDRQRRFCEEYVIDLNATQSDIRAGYSKNTAAVIGSENLSKENIKKYLDKLMTEREEEIRNSSLIPIDRDLFNRLYLIFDDLQELRKWVSYVVAKESIIEGLIDGKIRRKSIEDTTRYGILEKAGFKCQACGSKPDKDNDVCLEIDHIVPFSKGGLDIPDNYQVLCKKCNVSKGNKYSIDHNTDEYFNLQ